MSIKSIKIKNLLSFDELIIDNFEDINCIIGKNNTGKSNLLKLIKFFYNKLDGKRELPPELNSKYSAFGTITITYDMSRIYHIVSSPKILKTNFFIGIHNLFFSTAKNYITVNTIKKENNQTHVESYLELTLKINSNDSVEWSIKDKKVLKIINYLYPFFDIEARHINLYDWNNLWFLISRLKSFNVDDLKQDKLIDFLDEQISEKSRSYRNNIGKIQKITKTSKYSYREKVLNYIKVGLKGHTFQIENQDLEIQSDGTNSHKFIEIFLDLFISLSRTEYIEPIVYVDEPEIGLHPKRNEELIYHLHDTYKAFKKTKKEQEIGKYKTPYPKIIFATHSPNIVKQVIKLFEQNQQILHFSKKKNENTLVQKMHSKYNDKFLNIFSDNEARLFFSSFILFVEGETEVEIFSNRKLLSKFPKLKEIDVYKSSSNILSGEINPSARKISIPYLFLFDADKIYEFARENEFRKMLIKDKNKLLYRLPTTNKKNELTQSTEEFNKVINFYSKGYYSKKKKKYSNILNNMQYIKDIISIKFTQNKIHFKINERKLYDKCRLNLKKYLEVKHIFFNKTTMEESLISYESKELFFQWIKIKDNFDIDDTIYKKYKYHIYKHRIGIGKIKLFSPPKKSFFKIQKKVENEYLTKDILIEYIRVIFYEGKFETQVKVTRLKDKKNKNVISKEILSMLEKTTLKSRDKTSGWTTEFLNFAIDKIDSKLKETESKKRQKEFEIEFKKYFGELYDIITLIKNKL